MKRCSKCGLEKESSEFYSDRDYWCKACHRSVALARYHAGGEAARTAARERTRARRLEDPQGVREKEAAYWRQNPDKKAAKDRRWAQAHPEKRREIVKRWYALNPERGREHARNSTSAHKARKRAAFVERVEASVVFERHGGVCGICGSPVDPDRFDVDHIVPLARGGEHSYANTQPAHPVCNQRKGSRRLARNRAGAVR